MKSVVTEDFRERFAQLPPAIQQQARAAYRVFKVTPNHPGLRFHNVTVKRRGKQLWSMSIGIHHRALAQEKNGVLEWYWIGHHAVYDKLLEGPRGCTRSPGEVRTIPEIRPFREGRWGAFSYSL